jgi:hypothetical protein
LNMIKKHYTHEWKCHDKTQQKCTKGKKITVNVECFSSVLKLLY